MVEEFVIELLVDGICTCREARDRDVSRIAAKDGDVLECVSRYRTEKKGLVTQSGRNGWART